MTEREKQANTEHVQAYVRQGFSLPDAVRAAYPDWSTSQVAQFISQQEKQAVSLLDNLAYYGSGGLLVGKSKREDTEARYDKMFRDAMAERKKQLIAEGANPEDFADFAETDKEGSDVIETAFQAIKTPIVAAMDAFENKHKARQKEEGKMQTAVDRNVRERIARRIAKTRVPKIGADNSSKLLSNRHFEAPIKDENMTPQRQKLASLCDKLKGRGVRVPVKDKKVPSDGIKITKKTVSVSKPKLKVSSAVRLFPKKQRTKLAAFLISKYAEKKANEASNLALEQFTKLPEEKDAWDKTAKPLDFKHGMGRNLRTALALTAAPAITGGGGAVIGALINALRNKDVGRGAMTGAMTGAGATLGTIPAAMILSGLSNPKTSPDGMSRDPHGRQHPGSGFDFFPTSTENQVPYMLGANAIGLGAGGVGGYQLAQKYHDWRDGKKDENEENEEKEASIGRIAARATVKQAGGLEDLFGGGGGMDLSRFPVDVQALSPYQSAIIGGGSTLAGAGGGAIIGALINALKNKDVGRGAITGAMTGGGAGLGVVPGLQTLAGLSNPPGISGGSGLDVLPVTAGSSPWYRGGAAAGGAGIGGGAGYALAQKLQGKEEDDEKEAAFRVLANGARALARGETVKASFDMESVKKFWGGLKPWQQKSMIGGGAGLALGGLSGGLMGGGKGALYGAMAGGGLGALGGGLYDPIKNYFGKTPKVDHTGEEDVVGMIDEFNKLKEEGLPKHPSENSPFSSYGSFPDENYDPNYSVEDITGEPGQRHEALSEHPLGRGLQGIGQRLADPAGLAQASSDAVGQDKELGSREYQRRRQGEERRRPGLFPNRQR